MITIRPQADGDLADIVRLHNIIVARGGYSLSDQEFNREITELDWRDWQSHYVHTVRLVFENDDARHQENAKRLGFTPTFYGYNTFREGSDGEIVHEHLGVMNPDGVPEPEIMWLAVDWIKANTRYQVMVMERQDLTRVEHYDDLARELGATRDNNVWRKKLADARRPRR